jgi:beta-carotene 3-hydroxylase
VRVLIWLPVSLGVAVLMELWAGFLHGRLWHGRLWNLHGSHHQQRRGRFERNDALSGLHAPIAVGLILYGCVGPAGVVRELCYGVGLGMTAFGLAYFVVHDGLAHGRLPVGFLKRLRYFREVVEAHQAHHASRDCAPYGFFFGPAELHRARRNSRRATT